MSALISFTDCFGVTRMITPHQMGVIRKKSESPYHYCKHFPHSTAVHCNVRYAPPGTKAPWGCKGKTCFTQRDTGPCRHMTADQWHKWNTVDKKKFEETYYGLTNNTWMWLGVGFAIFMWWCWRKKNKKG